MNPVCQLCLSQKTCAFFTNKEREFFRCGNCGLIFAPAQYHLSPAKARARYELHQNSPADQGYRKFLGQLIDPLVKHLTPGMEGLDFGCGPGPTLSVLMEERGFKMVNYDPFFASDPRLLARQYDFVTCTETVEHFTDPRRDLELLLRLIKPGGVVGVMTELFRPDIDFGKWHYVNDLTHVSFFSEAAFSWFAREHGIKVRFHGNNVVLLPAMQPPLTDIPIETQS